MKNKILLITFLSITLILCYSSVIAPGPNMHLKLALSAINDPEVNNTLIANIIQNNLDACFVGVEYADSGIFEYYTNFKAYAGLHNYNMVDELLKLAKNDRDRAFAYCWKLHLAADSVSHNFFVPAEIRKTKLPNYIIHPIKELKIEGNYLDIRSNRMMEGHKEFDELVTKAAGRDWSGEAEKLNSIIGGGMFYDKAYAPDTVTYWGKLQNFFYKYIAYFVNDESEVDLYNLAYQESKAVLRGETNSLDPSGEEALMRADQETQLWLYLITLIVIIIIFYLSFRWNLIGFNKNKFKIR